MGKKTLIFQQKCQQSCITHQEIVDINMKIELKLVLIRTIKILDIVQIQIGFLGTIPASSLKNVNLLTNFIIILEYKIFQYIQNINLLMIEPV